MNPIAGHVDRVIDGDTVVVRIRVRTRGSAAELGTAAGREAAAKARANFPRGAEVSLRIHYVDAWGRPVAELVRAQRKR